MASVLQMTVARQLGNFAQGYADAAAVQPRLASAADDRLAQGRACLASCELELQHAQIHNRRCVTQVLNMEAYVRAADERQDSEDVRTLKIGWGTMGGC